MSSTRDFVHLQRIIDIASTFWLVVVILVITALYYKIYATQSKEISDKKVLNEQIYDFGTSDSESTPLSITNFFEDSIRMEQTYVRSVNISIAVTLLFFVVHDAVKWYISNKHWTVFKFTCTMGSFHYCARGGTIHADLVIFPALINPLVFCVNNEDFKIKLKRPLRALRKWAKRKIKGKKQKKHNRTREQTKSLQ